MKKTAVYTLMASLAWLPGPLLADHHGEKPSPLLADNGIPAANVEHVLPNNAILHAQIQNLQRIVENIEQFALNTIPDKAVPGAMRPLLHGEHPLLTLAGMPLIQAPLKASTIAERVGLDTEAPISVTLYPGDPTRSFVASIGLADANVLSMFLSQVLRPEMIETTSIGGRTITQVRLPGSPVQNLYVACSSTRLFATGDPSLILHLHESSNAPRLSEDPHMNQVLDLTKQKDVVLTVNPGLVKPLLGQLPFFKYMPLTFLAEARSEILRQIPTQQRQAIEEQLSRNLKIQSIEEFADYAECVLASTYEQVFDTLYASINGMNGTTLAIRVDNAYPEFSFYLHHDRFEPSKDTAPIPLSAVKLALSSIETDSQQLSVSGRSAPPGPSEWVSKWINRTRTLIEHKGLNTAFIDAIQSYHERSPRQPSLAALSPWTLEMKARVNPQPTMADYQTIEQYLGGKQAAGFGKQSRSVTVVPQSGTDFLRTYFQTQIANGKDAKDLSQSLFAERATPKLILNEQRLFEASLPNRVQQFTLDSAYVTQMGLFGFNEHEFINRKIYFAKALSPYMVYYQAAGDGSWLGNLSVNEAPDRQANLRHLVDHLPNDVNAFSAYRGLGDIMSLVNGIQNAEDLLHRDITYYLEEVEALASTVGDTSELVASLNRLPYSPAVAAINRDADGQFYCLLPGNLTFPRAKVTPVIGKLFADFQKDSANKGGAIAYTRTFEGAKEWSFMWNTEGLSSLVRSVGNAVAEQFLNNPQEIHRLQGQLLAKRDRDPNRMNEILARNPQWAFLEQIKIPNGFPGMPRAMTAREPAAPTHPIEARAEAASANLIDLSAHYNASLTETWHRGGVDDNDLSEFPQGVVTLNGITYDVRGIVQLTGKEAENALTVKFPKTSAGIPVYQTAPRLHFLHATGWAENEQTQIASYFLHYTDGESVEVPVVYGHHVRDWWTPSAEAAVAAGDIAWEGTNGASTRADRAVHIYHMEWENPRPEVAIETLDYVSTQSGSAPFLLAVTAEKPGTSTEELAATGDDPF